MLCIRLCQCFVVKDVSKKFGTFIVVDLRIRSLATRSVVQTVNCQQKSLTPGQTTMTYDYDPVALTVMVTLTGSLSSPGGGAWLVVGVAVRGEIVIGEDARGKAMVGPGKDQH